METERVSEGLRGWKGRLRMEGDKRGKGDDKEAKFRGFT